MVQDDRIKPPKGRPIVSLKDAAAYILKLPRSKQQSPNDRRPAKRSSWRRKIAGR
jgi:hypothetical protein